MLVDGQYHLYLSDWENVLDVLSCHGEGCGVSDDAQDLLAGLLQPDPDLFSVRVKYLIMIASNENGR